MSCPGPPIWQLVSPDFLPGRLRLSFDLAQDRECALHVLTIVPAGSGPAVIDYARATLGELLAGWAELYPEVPVVAEVIVGDPEAVCTVVTRDAELVLVGRSRRRGGRRSMAATLVRHTSDAVGVVPVDTDSQVP